MSSEETSDLDDGIMHWDDLSDQELADTLEGQERDLQHVPLLSGLLREIRLRLLRSAGPNRQIPEEITTSLRHGPRRAGEPLCQSSTARSATPTPPSKSFKSKTTR